MATTKTSPVELVTGRTVCLSPTAARELMRRLIMLGASSKMRTPLLPGWYVWLAVETAGSTCLWSMLAEPEADPQGDLPPF